MPLVASLARRREAISDAERQHADRRQHERPDHRRLRRDDHLAASLGFTLAANASGMTTAA